MNDESGDVELAGHVPGQPLELPVERVVDHVIVRHYRGETTERPASQQTPAVVAVRGQLHHRTVRPHVKHVAQACSMDACSIHIGPSCLKYKNSNDINVYGNRTDKNIRLGNRSDLAFMTHHQRLISVAEEHHAIPGEGRGESLYDSSGKRIAPLTHQVALVARVAGVR